MDSASCYNDGLQSLVWFVKYLFVPSDINYLLLSEHVVSNLGSNVFPYMILAAYVNSPPSTCFVWFGTQIILALCVHSGYHLPLLPSPVIHDYHHVKFTECLGHSGMLDWLHNTSPKFDKSVYSLRSGTMFSLTPSNVLFPDKN